MRRIRVRTFVLALLLPLPMLAWDSPGHELVAGIAWDNMTAQARQQAITILQKAPADACLTSLFPKDSRPLLDRQREFFMLAATWPDVIRPDSNHDPKCNRFHQREWHFIDHFWTGVSGGTDSKAPALANIDTPAVNAVERLGQFRSSMSCTTAACSPVVCDATKPCTRDQDRAMQLAWMLHLVGDIHQPLHTASHVTDKLKKGDGGGNLFPLSNDPNGPQLHGFWDHIIDDTIHLKAGEKGKTDIAYLDRVEKDTIVKDHPIGTLAGRIESGKFDDWSKEGFAAAEANAYPSTLIMKQKPSAAYATSAFKIAEEAIALGGYRLADLLNQMLDPNAKPPASANK